MCAAVCPTLYVLGVIDQVRGEMRRRKGVVRGRQVNSRSLWSLSASLLLPGLPSAWLVPSLTYVIGQFNLRREHCQRAPTLLFSILIALYGYSSTFGLVIATSCVVF
jgi:hypothetical protein